jgi:hypothetical protein
VRGFVAVAVEELGVVLFGTFGWFLVCAVVQEFQHLLLYFYLLIFLSIITISYPHQINSLS